MYVTTSQLIESIEYVKVRLFTDDVIIRTKASSKNQQRALETKLTNFEQASENWVRNNNMEVTVQQFITLTHL